MNTLSPIQISILISSSALLVLILILIKKRYAPDAQTTILLRSVLENNGLNTPTWLNRWIDWAALTPIQRYFQSINIGLNWMGKPQPVHCTAAERASILIELIPEIAPSISIVLREHQAALFTPHAGDTSLTRRAARRILYHVIILRIKIFVFG